MIIKKHPFPCQVLVETTYSKDDLKKIEEKILKAECNRINIPGFRPGGAPLSKIRESLQKNHRWEELFGTKLQEELVFDWGKEKEAEFGEIVKIVNFEVLKNEPLTLQCCFEYFPRLTKKDLGEKYKNLNIKKRGGPKNIRVSKEEVENGIKELQKRRTILQPVSGSLGKEKSAFLRIYHLTNGRMVDNEKEEKDLFQWGVKQYGEEFDKNTEGMKEGEEKVIDISGIKDKEIEKLRNVASQIFSDDKTKTNEKIELKIRVEKVFASKVPDVNDEFAKSLGKFKDLEELKSSLSRGMNLEKLYRERDQRKEALINVLLETIELKLPDSIIKNSASRHKENFIRNMENAAHAHGKEARDEEKMNKIFEERARKELKLQRILETIALEEKIVPDDKEVEEEIRKILCSFPSPKEVKEAFRNIENLRSRVTLSLCFDKTIKFLEKENGLLEDIEQEIARLEKERPH